MITVVKAIVINTIATISRDLALDPICKMEDILQ